MILFFNDSVGSKKSRYLEDFMEQDIVKIANSAVFSQIQGRSPQHCNLSHSAHVVNVTHLSLKYRSDSPQPLFL